MTAAGLVAKVGEWRARSMMRCYDTPARAAYETCAAELAPLADAVVAEVAGLRERAERAERHVAAFQEGENTLLARAESAEAELARVRAFIADDSLAITFQSLAQYRKACLAAHPQGETDRG